MQRPVGIQRHGTTRVVMLSLKEYERLKRRDREVIRTPAKSIALDNLMDNTEAG